MKKIIFACDGNNFPKAAFEFVKELQKTEPLLLTGTFLQSIHFVEMLPGLFATFAGHTTAFMEEEKVEFKNTIHLFEEMCQRNGIEYRVHEDSNNWGMDDLLKETRFADLMVMSEELFCTNINMTEPNSFMQRAIHKSECPVMLFPEIYKPLKKIVFAYDGKKESLFALKQFCNLFPQYSHLETKIVYSKPGHDDELPDMMYIEEYAGRHFSNLQFEKLSFNGRKYFADWAKEENDILIISGAYGRSGLSTAINKSFVEKLIEEHHVPVFIAHT